MKKVNCDVLIIGGGPSGGVCAMAAKLNYPEKEILVVREFDVQLVPCAQQQFVKLVAMRNGGQIIGGNKAGEMINSIGVMIESNFTVYQIMSLQVATQPMLTAAPTNYPIVMAATMIAQKIEHQL